MDKVEKNSYYVWNEIANFITKVWVWACFVGIGIIGKFGLYFQSGQKYSFWKLMGSTLIAGFVGYLASVYCMAHYPIKDGSFSKEGAFIVPIATLMSDRLMMVLVSVNWGTVMEIFIDKRGKEKPKEK